MLSVEDSEWECIPVETVDEVILRGDMIECKRLKNWNRWLKIRKQQHKHLGLKVCRRPTELLMNESDTFRSKVECKWMANVKIKTKINSEYNRDFPYSISNEIKRFTSVRIPDIIRTEKGLFDSGKNVQCNLEMQTSNNSFFSNELNTLKSLMPLKSSEKLAIIGENILNKTKIPKFDYNLIIPSINIETAPKDETCDHNTLFSLIIVRINDIIVKSINNSCKCETYKLEKTSKSIKIAKGNEDVWDEIIIENRGQMSINYKWKKQDSYTTTEYDCILKKQSMGCFYFDTRSSVLGPGQVKHITVLFRPTSIGPHREIWFCQLEMFGRLDHIAEIEVPLQGCALSSVDDKAFTIKNLQNIILSEKHMHVKSINRIHENQFPESKSAVIEKYQYHSDKMKQLYRILNTENPLSIEECLRQCMELEQSFREKFLDLISHTAVILLKKEFILKCDGNTQHELNAYKTMYITMDNIDLILHTYEPDYDEVEQELNKNSTDLNRSTTSENDLVDSTMNQITADNYSIREEWNKLIRPMIYKRIEWAVKRIIDYDIQWTECKHSTYEIAKKN